jgi:hypothetical protein
LAREEVVLVVAEREEAEVVEEKVEGAVEEVLAKELVLAMREDGQVLLETLALEVVQTIHLPSKMVCVSLV